MQCFTFKFQIIDSFFVVVVRMFVLDIHTYRLLNFKTYCMFEIEII